MSERGLTYDDVLGDVTRSFEELVASAEEGARQAGGRFLSDDMLRLSMAMAIRLTVGQVSDVGLLGVYASRPDLLHVKPELHGTLPTPRGALDHALKDAVHRSLSDLRVARLGEGRDADTLPEIVEKALAALADLESSGTRNRDAADTRRLLASGDWENPLVRGMGSYLARFLSENGHAGIGNDLAAAFDAREAVMARSISSAPR